MTLWVWVFDTDRVSLFKPNHPVVTERINVVNSEEIAVTIITLEEQLYGRLNGIRRANSPEKVISAYAKLSATWKYFTSINLLDLTKMLTIVTQNSCVKKFAWVRRICGLRLL